MNPNPLPHRPLIRREPLIIEGRVLPPGTRPSPPPARSLAPPRQAVRMLQPQAAPRRPARALAAGLLLALIVGVCVPAAGAIAGLFASGNAIVIDRVTSTTLIAGGEPALVVEGTLTNPTRRALPVPAVRVSLRDGGSEAYAWTVEPATGTLAAGASIGFRSALKNPVSGSARVVVSLVPREQRVGMR